MTFAFTPLAVVTILSGLSLGTKFINFAIFAIGMGFVLYKPITQGLQARAQTIQDDLQKANREMEAAQAKIKQLEARLNNLDHEITDIRAQAERDAKTESERIVQSAKEDAERLRAMARLEIEGAYKAARTQLKAFAAQQAVELAENLIRSEIKDADRDRLVTRYVEQLERIH